MKKVLSILMSVLIVLNTITFLSFSVSGAQIDSAVTGTSKTQSEAVAWVVSQSGKSIDFDGWYGPQCVDLIAAYYSYLGDGYASGHAKDYVTNALPAGWYRDKTPSAGAIVVWGPGSYTGKKGHYADATYGHVGIVTSVNGAYIDYYDQNSYQHGQTVGIHYSHEASYAAAYIHPNFAGTNLDLGNDFYGFILNQPVSKTIGQADNGNVELIYEAPKTMDRIMWHFTKNSDGTYTITSMLNGKVLEVAGASAEDRANVQCHEVNGSDAQKWEIFWNVLNSSFYLSAKCTSKVMDLENGNSSEGNNIQMYTQSSHEAQRFAIFKVTDEYTIDYNINSDKNAYEFGENVKLTIGGNLSYVYNYQFIIKDSYGEETVVDNKCNSVLDFTPEKEGTYTVYAQVKNPIYTDTGSYTDRAVTFTVGCPHDFSERFVEATANNSQGYVLHSCKKCGDSYKDGYVTYNNGWYYSQELPQVIENGDYEVEYNNYYEKEQKDSPGSDWTQVEVIKNEWQNVGGEYTTYIPEAVSDSKILVREYYYHWCGPSTGAYANHTAIDSYQHYDQISLPNDSVHVTWTGEDEGHPVYTLAYADGSAVFCQSGVTCDGAWGTHSARSKAWYKYYVYQNREKIEIYKYTKESGWTTKFDETANSTTYRFKATSSSKSGDVDGDNDVTIMDATAIQRYKALFSVTNFNEALADYDNDGEISILDATAIQRFIAML